MYYNDHIITINEKSVYVKIPIISVRQFLLRSQFSFGTRDSMRITPQTCK
jgi:hypothetical protein